MVIYIDIDETICNSPNKPDYTASTPIGTQTGIDWTDVTKKQFSDWGVRYHDLKFGKPYYDLFIDDKNMNTLNWK